MVNKQDNKTEGGKEKSLHDKVVHIKSSTAGLKQLYSRPPFHCKSTIDCMGTMWVCIHPVPLTPPLRTNEVDTGLSTIHDLRPELFVGLM